MHKLLLLLTGIVIITSISLSCSKDKTNNPITTVDCSTITNKAFAADVNPIIQSSCNQAGCHAAGSVNGPGPLTNHSQVAGAAASVRNAIATGKMPQTGTLSTTQRSSIICWIDSGAPNN